MASARRCFQDVAIADGFSEMEIPRWGLGLRLLDFSFHVAGAVPVLRQLLLYFGIFGLAALQLKS